jgi:hypothetical protein
MKTLIRIHETPAGGMCVLPVMNSAFPATLIRYPVAKQRQSSLCRISLPICKVKRGDILSISVSKSNGGFQGSRKRYCCDAGCMMRLDTRYIAVRLLCGQEIGP